jgi:hypothetical protein
MKKPKMKIGFIVHGEGCPKGKNPKKKCTCGVEFVAECVQGWVDNINATDEIPGKKIKLKGVRSV